MANPGTGANLPLGSLTLLWLAGLYLRLPILVAPPLSPLIGSELDLGQTALGALTTLPVLMLAVGALPGSFAIARVGPRLAVAGALILLAIASAARGLAPPVLMLFVFTVLMGFAIAVMQPALPVLGAGERPRTGTDCHAEKRQAPGRSGVLHRSRRHVSGLPAPSARRRCSATAAATARAGSDQTTSAARQS